MKFFVPALLVLGLAGCDKEIHDEIVNPPEVTHPGTGSDGDTGGDGSAGDGFTGEPGDASVIPVGDGAVPPRPDEPFSKRALLAASGECAVSHYRTFADLAADLGTATTAFAESPNEETRRGARDAFRRAFSSFQRAELFRFGPAARAMDDPGGRDLRDQIYAYPQNLACVVDQRVVDKKYETDYANILIGARGLSSIEYLAFYEGESNACAPAIGINRNGTWDALGAGEIGARRAAYAARSAADVQRHIAGLLDAWAASGDDFQSQLTNPGSGKTYVSEQAALNAVSHGLFYLETEMKDWKLGLPLGLVEGCAETTCPNSVESRFARVSTDNLRQNLVGFRKLFQGCGDDYEGFGFDDWLIAVGAEDLARRMLSALTVAQTRVEDLAQPMEESIVSSPDKVRSVHTAIKALNDLLKTEFVSALNLELPMGAEGDND